MIKSYYKIADHYRINELGINCRHEDVKFLTEMQYYKALKELMRKRFNYIACRECWERVNEDDTTDIVFFADYKQEI